MKRKGRSPAEEQREPCGVWLDTSALKKRKMQTLIAKPTLSMQKRPLLYPAPEKVPLPFTKQTTISTFFRTQPAGEKKASTNPGLSGAASESHCNPQGCESLEGERSQLAAVSFPALREFQVTQRPPHRTSAQSNSGRVDRAEVGKSTREADDLDFIQHLEAKGVMAHTALSRSPLRDKNGSWRTPSSTPYSQTSQNLKVLRSRPSCSKSHVSDSSNTENTDPQWERRDAAVKRRGLNRNRTGLRSETAMALGVPDEGPENSQLRCSTPLFSQDSEGHRVISHHFSGEPGNLCLPKRPLWNKSNQRIGPAYRDCLGACFSAESGSQRPAGEEVRLDSCYDLLFTEDSEGNRVIKH